MAVPLGAMHLSLFAEDQNGNDITCPSDTSSDSPRNSSSHGKTNSPVDAEMTEDRVNELMSTSSIIKQVDLQTNLATVSYMSTVNDNCSQNLSFMISGFQNGNMDSKSTIPDVHGLLVKKCAHVAKMCSNTDAQQSFVVGSVTPSPPRSSENHSSVSSSEMLIRGNSFIIHESDQPLSASVLEESSNMSSEVGVVPGLLPDVCEGLFSDVASAPGQNDKHPDFGVTFIQPSNQTFTMEEDVFQAVPHNGPLQSKASHLFAAVTHSECVTPVNLKKSHIEALRSTSSTSAEGKAFQIPTSEELDISGNAQTSTPVQAMSSKTFCFSDSSFNKSKSDFGSPLTQDTNQQQSSVSQKPRPSLTASTKSNKLEIKTYVKPDFSNVKSKIMSRPTCALKPSTATVVNASSNIGQQKNQTRPSHSMQSAAPPNKNTSASSSSSTLICGRLKKNQNNVIKRTFSSTYQDTAPAPKSRPRTWSECSSSSKTKEDTTAEDKQVGKVVNTITNEKSSSVRGLLSQATLTKFGHRHSSSKEDRFIRTPQKSSPKADLSRPVGAALCDWRKSSLGSQPLSSRAGGSSPARTPAASLRPPPLSASKLKPGTAQKNGCTTTDMPSSRNKLSTSGGNPSMRVTEGTRTEGTVGTISRISLPTGPHSSASKLPLKTRTQLKSLSGHTKPDLESPSGALGKPTTNKTTSLRTRLQSLSPKVSSFGNKNTSSQPHTSARSAGNVLKPPASSRPAQFSAAFSVDKSKAKGSSRTQQQGNANSHPDLVPPETKPRGLEYYRALCEKKNQTIQHLKNSLIASNRKSEAIAVVVQTLYKQHEVSVKRHQERSLELLNLREELVSSEQSCERLEKEKEELHVALEGVLQKVQEQHRLDLADLEERLKTFYSNELEKIQQLYQEEAEKYKAQTEQQLEELRAKHEALQTELEESHEKKVEGLKQHYEESFEELRKSHEQEMQALEKMQKDTEETLSSQIEELITANSYFSERLKAEEDRRKELAEKCQDSHTLYLEQELESLKVVLDIKNKQIHQQDKKLMQMDKLMEKNVVLDECLKKVQQENEDLKARMDKHAALSRQLSTEQAVLQESLQKETKVNKRLSMENEELLWKLQNGDLSSPRKVSPSSTSMTLQSPRHSGLFSSPPVSPR